MKTTTLMLLIVIWAVVTTAQEHNTLQSTDSLELKGLFFPGPKNSLGNFSTFAPLQFADSGISRDFPASSFGMALLSEPSVAERSADYSWRMTLSQKNRDPLETLRMMLRGIEAGGVSYLAYRHISKYGFLK